MYKNNVLSFSYEDWKGGLKSSPYEGLSDIRNVDPHSKKGALLCGRKPTAYTSGQLDNDAYTAFDVENDIVYYGLANGELLETSYTGTSLGTFSSTIVSAKRDCKGLAYWKGNILYAGDLFMEVYNIAGNDWYGEWEPFAEGTRNSIDLPHHTIVGRDDVVYVTDGINIASLQQSLPGTPFDPNVSSTYTWNNTALDLPDGYVASSLSEYGKFLIIGSYFNEQLGRGNKADIFPWDRVSQSFNNPIRSKGNGVWASIEHNGRLFAIFDTNSQKLVETNLSVYQVVQELRLLSDTARIYADAIDVVDNEILFGIGSRSNSATGCGIYGHKQEGGIPFTHLKNVLSCGDTGVEIISVLALDENNYLATWRDDSSGTSQFGVDLFTDNVYDDYSSYVVTPYQIVAKHGSPKQFKTINITLGKKLVANQGIRVSYRANRDDAFTELKEFDFTSYGAVASMSATIEGMSPVTGLEVKVELKGSGTASPEFISMTLE